MNDLFLTIALLLTAVAAITFSMPKEPKLRPVRVRSRRHTNRRSR